MDVGLTNSIVSTSTALASRQTSDAINITVLKKALDVQASAAATGQDVGFMLDSLVKGIGRGSPMILDNLGL